MNTTDIIVYKAIPVSEFFLGLLLVVAGIAGLLFFVGPFVLQVLNPKREILLIITRDGVSLPASGKRPALVELSWNEITKIHWEDYKVRQGKGYAKHKELCFCTQDNHVSVNSRYLSMPAAELFQAIQEYYKGPILREYEQGRFQTYTNFGNCWDWKEI